MAFPPAAAGGRRKQNKARLEARRLKVLQLTVAGGSSRTVAQQLEREGYGKVSHTTVQKDLRAVLKQLAGDMKGEAENQRVLMNERYNRLFLSWWGPALGHPESEDRLALPPDGQAAGKILSILKAMRELNGLDVAVAQKLEHTGANGGPIIERVEINWHDARVEASALDDVTQHDVIHPD